MIEYWDGTGLTAEAVAREVYRLGQERPDFVYSEHFGTSLCRYTHAGKEPACIVGAAIYNLTGKPVDQNAMAESVADGSWRSRLGAWSVKQTKAWEFLCAVQYRQDMRCPWGTAVEEAVSDSGWEPPTL